MPGWCCGNRVKSILIFYKGYDDDGGDGDGGDDDDQDDEHVYGHLYCEHHIGYLFLCSSLFQTTVMLVDSLHARRPLLQGSVCVEKQEFYLTQKACWVVLEELA